MRPQQIVEATLFASQTPLSAAEIARADEALDAATVVEAIRKLREKYEAEEHAFQVYQLGDGFQLLTRPEYAPYLERFDSVPRSPTLSAAAVETLAIIAYRQPISRIEIEEVRGVGASSVLRTLLDWDLIEVVGRGEGLGRPLLYGTSHRFLDHFGFKDLSELPGPETLPVTLRGLREDIEGEKDRPAEAVAAAAESGAPGGEPGGEARPAVDETAEAGGLTGAGPCRWLSLSACSSTSRAPAPLPDVRARS
ncbi:MAG: SMC-Scp complex subunit ScpB [Gemmatimonadota bacterium]